MPRPAQPVELWVRPSKLAALAKQRQFSPTALATAPPTPRSIFVEHHRCDIRVR